jgi:large subunit ribosomal protein L4
MKLEVKNIQGTIVETMQVRDDVFAVPAKPALVHQVMVGQLANERQGTSGAKTRAEVSGGGRKPRPQKSTGAARAGTIRAPHWRGGGVVFAVKPRSYRQNTPKKMRRLSLVSTLSDKVREGDLIVLESVALESPKTREMVAMIEALGGRTPLLFVADGADETALRAARNVPGLNMAPSRLLNTLQLLRNRTIIMTVDAIRATEELWGGVRHKRRLTSQASK